MHRRSQQQQMTDRVKVQLTPKIFFRLIKSP